MKIVHVYMFFFQDFWSKLLGQFSEYITQLMNDYSQLARHRTGNQELLCHFQVLMLDKDDRKRKHFNCQAALYILYFRFHSCTREVGF